MIIRVLGEGQWVLEVDDLEALNQIDDELEDAVAAGDEAAMRDALERLFVGIKERGTEVPHDVIAESDLVMPDPDASLEEVKLLLESTSEYYGLLPGGPARDGNGLGTGNGDDAPETDVETDQHDAEAGEPAER